MSRVLRASFIGALTKALDAMRELTALLSETQTPEERIALLRAVHAQALTVIMLVNEVLDARTI